MTSPFRFPHEALDFRVSVFERADKRSDIAPRFLGAPQGELTRDNRGACVSGRAMPKKAATLEQLKADYIAECEAALMFHQRAQEAQRQVSQMREMHRQLKRDKGQKDNAAALEASIRAAEADANALEAQRVRASATAETLKVEMWAAVRQIGMAGEVR